jgi:signal transduction histidine kinase
MRTTSLAWALGAFLVGVGVLMLVSPHQFSAAGYDALRPALPWWAGAFCLAGTALLAAPVFALRRSLRLVAHAAASVALFSLAVSFSLPGIWGSAAAYAVLGVATLAAGVISRSAAGAAPDGQRRGPDLLVAAMAAVALLHAAGLLALPTSYRAPTYDPIRPSAAVYGAAFLAAGVALMVVQWAPRRPGFTLFAAAHALAGAVFVAWAAGVMLPNRAWTGVALNAGVGGIVALLPWLTRAAPLTADSSSLRARLTLALAAAAAAPLVIAATLIARQEERAARVDALTRQQSFAGVIAQDAAQYVGLHRSAVAALASQIALLHPSVSDQTALLEAVSTSFPAFSFLATYDASAAGVARSTPRAPEAVARLPLFERARETRVGTVEVLYRPDLSPGPVFATASPIIVDGVFTGVVLGAVESTRLFDLLATPRLGVGAGGETYLVDSLGRAIAHPDASLAATLTDFSKLPPVAALLAQGDDQPRALSYRGWAGEQLVGYARVPGLGWGTVIERPAAIVLADSYTRRDQIFGLLMLAIGTAATAGFFAAGRLTRALSAQARAADALAAERSDAPLPHSTVLELDRLSGAFRAMRDRLAARTAEREEAIRMRDNVLGTVSHDLKNPLTTIALRAHVLQDETAELVQDAEEAEHTATAPSEGRAAFTDRLAGIADGLGRIVAATHRMQSMIDELVDTARLHTGQRLDLKRRPVDIVALATVVAEEYRQAADRHRVELSAPEDELVGEWDPARLERVLHNLAGNAVKYSPEGGMIEIRVRRETNGNGHDAAVVSVQDQGVGIPASDLPHLFQRFYRASNVAGRIRGTGLGLYSAREIIQQHGGSLEVESREGRGSTFTVRLPLSPLGSHQVEL